MANSPSTRPSLLIRIRDAQDREAWEQFVEIYAPLIFGFARKRGLQNADAADLTQEVLQSVARSIRRLDYDRRRGTFRGWLLTVTRNALRKHQASRNREPQGSGGSGLLKLLQEHPEDNDGDAMLWKAEHERCLFRWAAERVRCDFRPSTWEVFWEIAVKGRSTRDVADEVGLSLGAAYTAKSRVITRLREEIDRLRREDMSEF